MKAALDAKMPEWLARNIVPNEEIGDISNYDRGHKMYGMTKWTDVFAKRQLLGHCTSVEVFQELVVVCGGVGNVSDIDAAAMTYIAIVLSRSRSITTRECLFGW